MPRPGLVPEGFPAASRVAIRLSVRTIRSSIEIWYQSTVSDSRPIGLSRPPALKATEVSALRGEEPSAWATGLPTGSVTASRSTPPTLLVAEAAKNRWARPGARKPVETAPRIANQPVTAKRVAALPFTSEPRAEQFL